MISWKSVPKATKIHTETDLHLQTFVRNPNSDFRTVQKCVDLADFRCWQLWYLDLEIGVDAENEPSKVRGFLTGVVGVMVHSDTGIALEDSED